MRLFVDHATHFINVVRVQLMDATRKCTKENKKRKFLMKQNHEIEIKTSNKKKAKNFF